LCVIGDILPLFFLGERLRVREEESDGEKSISSKVPNLLWMAMGSFAPLGTRSLSCLALFLCGELFRLRELLVAAAATGSTETAAADFAGVAATTLAADPAEAVDVFKEIEFCFTGVCGRISFSQTCVDISFDEDDFKTVAYDGRCGFGTLYMLLSFLAS
jgi:hypothetical protein